MDQQRLELLLIKLKLSKKINQLIFESIYQYYFKKNYEILKIKDSFSFSITSPNDPSGRVYLMVANFLDENGFVQTQVVDDRLPVEANLNIINNFEDLIYLIEEFTKFDNNFNISLDSEDSKDYPDNNLNIFETILNKENSNLI